MMLIRRQPETEGEPNPLLASLGSPVQNAPGQANLVNTAAGAAGTLAGWAISSLGKVRPLLV